MQISRFKATADSETLSVAIYGSNPKPNFVFLHGAGTGNKERIESIAAELTDKGISLLAFDFSGHGESSGKLSDSSLRKRVDEAFHIIDQYADKNNLTLISASMGGYIAIKLTEKLNVNSLILFYPSVYDPKAYDLNFDQRFTEAIRRENSWKDSDAYRILNDFTGNLLVIQPQHDKVVPEEVAHLLEENSPRAGKKEILSIPDSPHALLPWVKDKPEVKDRIINKIYEFTR